MNTERFFNSLLADNIPLNEIGASLKFSTDKAYRTDKFLRHARIAFSKSKTDINEFNNVYNILISVAFANGFDDLQRDIDNIRNNVLASHLPLDNLRQNKNPQTKPITIPAPSDNNTVFSKLISRSVKTISKHIELTISGIAIGVITGIILYYFGLNGDKPQTTTPSTDTTTTVKTKP